MKQSNWPVNMVLFLLLLVQKMNYVQATCEAYFYWYYLIFLSLYLLHLFFEIKHAFPFRKVIFNDFLE